MPLFSGRQQVVALDPVWPMLSINPAPQRVVGKGERLPFADGTFDGIWSAFVFRNLQSVEETLVEAARVLRPGGVMVVVDAGRPLSRLAAPIHRTGTAMVTPLVGLLAGAVREYWYFHRSMDKLPHPEEMFRDGPSQSRQAVANGDMGKRLRSDPGQALAAAGAMPPSAQACTPPSDPTPPVG